MGKASRLNQQRRSAAAQPIVQTPTMTTPASAASTKRREIIQAIEAKRQSRLLTYMTADRQGAAGQIAEDAVRPMYDHLLRFGKQDRIDLLLYSVGGHTDVPW